MVKKVTSQPGCARKVSGKVENKKIYSSRHVYNSRLDVLGTQQAYKAPFALWKQWLTDSNTCKPVIPSRTFAGVVKQNAYSCNISAKKSVPLEATQMYKPKGMPPGSVKEENIQCTASPQVPVTPANIRKRHTQEVNSANDTVVNDISLSNRFAILQSEDDQELTTDTDSQYEFLDRDFQCTSPCSGKALPDTENMAWDIFDKMLLKKKVDQDIIVQAKSCDDYVRCKSQMNKPFGVIPLSPLKIYTGAPTNNPKFPDPLLVHRCVRASGCHNFMGLQIPIHSNLNIPAWRSHLENYWDQQLVDLLEFGFPLDFDRNLDLVSSEVNHASATKFSDHVDEYIKEELSHGAMLGPFHQKPLQLHVFPFMTREKADSDLRRTIVDLSWPIGQSVNSGIAKDMYLGAKFLLNYPSVDNIIDRLIQLGPGSMLFKIDISRAFRQLKVDPGDIDLLGLKQTSYFIDQLVPFGYRHGSISFEKVTDSIRFIMKNHGFPDMYNYVDDLIYCGTPSTIFQAYEMLSSLLHELGLQISAKKLVPPSTSVTCLGILIDTETRTMSVPSDKLQHILKLCHQWENKITCTKQQLQSLLGSLLYIFKCVKPARAFLNRMLQFLRDMGERRAVKLSQEFFKDLAWFKIFLIHFNGIVYYDTRPVQAELHLDASLTGYFSQPMLCSSYSKRFQ